MFYTQIKTNADTVRRNTIYHLFYIQYVYNISLLLKCLHVNTERGQFDS